MSPETLQRIYVERLKDLHSTERQVLQAFPEWAGYASDERLRLTLEGQARATVEQLARLDRIFEQLGESPAERVARGIEGLIEEASRYLSEDIGPEILDSELVAAFQRIEQYEISQYETAKTYAGLLGEGDALRLLQISIEEVAATLRDVLDLSADIHLLPSGENPSEVADLPLWGSSEAEEADLRAEEEIREGKFESPEALDRLIQELRGRVAS